MDDLPAHERFDESRLDCPRGLTTVVASDVPLVEAVSEVVVGQLYSVPVIKRRGRCFAGTELRLVPVIGPLHEDREHIGFPDKHWHPDRRFMPERWFDSFIETEIEGAHWASVFTPRPHYGRGRLRRFPAAVIDDVLKHGDLVVPAGRRVMKCLRLVGSFVNTLRRDRIGVAIPPSWLRTLEPAYKHERMRNMICPHRGISCVGVIPESDGGVVCPGHGLKWDTVTGEMISRMGGDDKQRSLL